MISREEIKSEIDKVENEYLEPLYKIIKALEKSDSLVGKAETNKTNTLPGWSQFINETYGCLSEAPIERHHSFIFEHREEIE